jgi:hypothetical protein
MAKQQQTPSVLPPQSTDQGAGFAGFEQVGGNAFAQSQLGLGAAQPEGGTPLLDQMGLGAGAEGAGAEGLMNRVRAVTDARVDAVSKVWDRVESAPAAVDWQLKLLSGAITGAIMAATAGFTEPVIAAAMALPGLSTAARKILSGFTTTMINGHLPALGAYVDSLLLDEQGRGVPVMDAYFLAAKGALRMEGIQELDAYQNLCDFLLQEGAPPQVIERLSLRMDYAIPRAEELQMQQTVTNWMIFLATLDTGGDEKNGSDTGRTGSGRNLGEKIRGEVPRGIVHLHCDFLDPKNEPVITKVRIDGLPASLLPYLMKPHEKEMKPDQQTTSLNDLGLPIWIGSVDNNGNSIEIGRNERGVMVVTYNSEVGERWMSAYALFHAVDPEKAPSVLADHLGEVPVASMPMVLG